MTDIAFRKAIYQDQYFQSHYYTKGSRQVSSNNFKKTNFSFGQHPSTLNSQTKLSQLAIYNQKRGSSSQK